MVAVQQSRGNPGRMAAKDLRYYRAIAARRSAFAIARPRFAMGPPSSGGVAVRWRLRLTSSPSTWNTPRRAKPVHLIREASRLAFADRDRYLADSDPSPCR